MICVACILSACGRDSASINTSEPPVVQHLSEMTTEQNVDFVTESDFVEYGDNEGTEITTFSFTENTTININGQEDKSKNMVVKNLKDTDFWWKDLEPHAIHDNVAESFLNADPQKIKSFFCKKATVTHDLDSEITNALAQIDGNIVEYLTDYNIMWTSASSFCDGQLTEHHSDVYIKGLKTDTGKVYEIVFVLVDTSAVDEDEIGIQRMIISEEYSKIEHTVLCSIGEYFEETRREERNKR